MTFMTAQLMTFQVSSINQPSWNLHRDSANSGINHTDRLICSLYPAWLFIAYLRPEAMSSGPSLKLNQKDK